MKISTFNIKNDFKDYNSDKSKTIYEFLKNNNIDVLGLQEVFYRCDKDLLKELKNKYNIVGKYRFYLKLLHLKKKKKTPIITNHKVLFNKTYHLPHKLFGLKRIITCAVIEYKGKKISIYNTHLEVKDLNIKEKQLNIIYSILKKDTNYKILMGDFNFRSDNNEFSNFVKKLEKLNMNRIILNERTLKNSKRNLEIDHIFISNNFKLKSKEVIKDLDISDHYPVLIEIDID